MRLFHRRVSTEQVVCSMTSKILVLLSFFLSVTFCASELDSNHLEAKRIMFPGDSICGNGGFNPSPVKRYHVYHDQRVDFLGAWNACLRNGQRMATVTSAEDATLLEETLDKVHRMSIYYIGGMKLGDDNRSWFWVSHDFTKLTGYTNWNAGQPDIVEERCLEIGRFAKWTWNDISCHVAQHYICED
uniref:Perlucin n=1 Tax=Culex pipiens TaxID=7175 RepID=A0A8D8G0U8_CULPI